MNEQKLEAKTQESTEATSRRGVFGLVAGGLLALGLAGTQSAAARRGGRGHGRRGNGRRHGRRNNRNNHR